ncbi:hypothetical protein [Acinetobacter sp. CFCC 10889]|uniref:hypothetical protein n=1 Tax=Acinetobacter sp. CFCC 10889 TaxID=1775557 RepID=UPI000DD0CB34|nr:hypothetical protein [Acinetobacter sp. CFCC 10889]
MEIVELLQPITFKKTDLPAITIETGTLLKVTMVNPSSYLVEDESGFSFLLNFKDEDTVWKKI